MKGDPNCERCEGIGWVMVQPGYGEEHIPMPPELLTLDPTSNRAINLRATWEEAKLNADEGHYPCPECRRVVFIRWRGGHMDSDHNRATCDDEGCQLVMAKHR